MNKIFRKWLGKYVSEYLNTTVIYLMDVFLSVAASGIVILIAIVFFDHVFPSDFILWWLASSALTSMVVFYLTRSYRVIIRHSTMRDLGRYTLAIIAKDAVMYAALSLLFGASDILFLLLMLDFFIGLFLLFMVRLLMIMVYDQMKKNSIRRRNCINVLVFGTSDKSVAIATRLSNSPHYRVVGFLADNDGAGHMMLSDFPVFHCADARAFELFVRDHSIGGLLFATEKDAGSGRSR